MTSEKCSVVIPGNTNTGLTTGNKPKLYKTDFQLTLNNEKNGDVDACNFVLMQKYNKLIDYLTNLKYRYIISCLEKNSKGFNHIHIYIQFDKARKLSIKKCQGAHVEICRGSTQENIDYIKKDGNILIELGTPKIYRKASINDIINNTNNQDLKDLDIRLIKCINEVKNNSILWDQPIFNTSKDIYFLNNYDKNIINNCKCINIIKDKFQGLSNNILIDLTDYIDYDYAYSDEITIQNKLLNLNIYPLLQKLNKPLNCINQNFYPADIKKIVFIYSNGDKDTIDEWYQDRLNLFKNHNIKISINDRDNYLNYKPELDD